MWPIWGVLGRQAAIAEAALDLCQHMEAAGLLRWRIMDADEQVAEQWPEHPDVAQVLVADLAIDGPRRKRRRRLRYSDRELIDRYIGGSSIRQLANECGVSVSNIYERLYEQGIKMRPPGGSRKRRNEANAGVAP